MANTDKRLSERDGIQTLQSSYNDVNATLGVDGFIVGKIGRKVELTISTTNVANDTEVLNFSELGTPLYEFTVIYTDGSRETLLSAERTA